MCTDSRPNEQHGGHGTRQDQPAVPHASEHMRVFEMRMRMSY